MRSKCGLTEGTEPVDEGTEVEELVVMLAATMMAEVQMAYEFCITVRSSLRPTSELNSSTYNHCQPDATSPTYYRRVALDVLAIYLYTAATVAVRPVRLVSRG